MTEPRRRRASFHEPGWSRRVALAVARDRLARRRLDLEVALDPRLAELVGDHAACDRNGRALASECPAVRGAAPSEAVADDRALGGLQILRLHLDRALQDEPAEERRVRDLAVAGHVGDTRQRAASEQAPRRLALRAAGQGELTLGQRRVELAPGHLRPGAEAVVPRPEVDTGRGGLVRVAIRGSPFPPAP